MDTRFCIDALDEALARYGAPRIFNTDQGSQFTSEAFTGRLIAAGVAISMDGRGRFLDNIFIERLWRSIKYEEIHLKAYANGREARAGIGSWMTFTTRSALTRRWIIKCRWPCGAPAWKRSKRWQELWICRFAWTNANALPTYHSAAASGRGSLIFEGQEQAVTLNSSGPWSHEWGPLQRALSATTALRRRSILSRTRQRKMPGDRDIPHPTSP